MKGAEGIKCRGQEHQAGRFLVADPLAIIALGAVDIAQNGSLSSQGASTTFHGPVAVQTGFLLLVTVPLCWRFRAPVAVVILVTASSGVWILAMFKAQNQPPFEPALAIFVALFALANRADGRPLWTGAAVSVGIFTVGEIRGELAGQGNQPAGHRGGQQSAWP